MGLKVLCVLMLLLLTMIWGLEVVFGQRAAAGQTWRHIGEWTARLREA
jgi:hypothetical protein